MQQAQSMITNRSFYGVVMTKMKINKIAEVKKLRVQ
jgi:hypothetical protein